jgi:hypothetical protein
VAARLLDLTVCDLCIPQAYRKRCHLATTCGSRGRTHNGPADGVWETVPEVIQAQQSAAAQRRVHDDPVVARTDTRQVLPGPQTTSKLAIIIMSSCSRLWQWKT